MNKWNGKNALWMLLYALLYAALSAVVCVTGVIHPVFFTGYQVTASLLLSGIIIAAFARVKAPGTAACLALGMLLLLVIIHDAVAWHVIPLVVIAVLTEIVRAVFGYRWTGDVIGTAIMSFSTFGYYGQIWFNRTYCYECAIEEMPAGYGDTLMAVSPVWALPLVVLVGIALSVVVAHCARKLFHLEY